jgi:hypothetical protein
MCFFSSLFYKFFSPKFPIWLISNFIFSPLRENIHVNAYKCLKSTVSPWNLWKHIKHRICSDGFGGTVTVLFTSVPSKASNRYLLNNAISKAGGTHHSWPKIHKKLSAPPYVLACVALPVARSAPCTYCPGKVKYKNWTVPQGGRRPPRWVQWIVTALQNPYTPPTLVILWKVPSTNSYVQRATIQRTYHRNYQ